MMKSIYAALLAGLSLTVGMTGLVTKAQALDLYTGEKTGAYFNEFCPTIKKAAKEKNVLINCRTSQGSLENLDKIIEKPTDFGLAQYDLFSLKYASQSNQLAYTPIRDDLGKECLFLVTKNKLMKNFGDVAASAPYMNFILPPEMSGHAGSFKYLQSIDPTGLGKATKVTYAASTEDAITSALAQEDNVTLFVQFPDADNKLFKLVNENGGHFVPVISREILAQETRGRKVYAAEETGVANPKWHESGKKVVTACTPMVLFTGKYIASRIQLQKTRMKKPSPLCRKCQLTNYAPKRVGFQNSGPAPKRSQPKALKAWSMQQIKPKKPLALI